MIIEPPLYEAGKWSVTTLLAAGLLVLSLVLWPLASSYWELQRCRDGETIALENGVKLLCSLDKPSK